MKMNLDTNYNFTQGLAPVSVAVGTDAGASVDHADGPCAAFVLNCGAFASGARITMKLQYSDDDTTYTDDAGESGNDYTVTRTAAGMSVLDVPNPQGRYSRGFITVATDAVVNGITNVIGPLRKVAPTS